MSPRGRRCNGRTPRGFRCSRLEGHSGGHDHPNEDEGGRALMAYQRRLALEQARPRP